MSRHEPVRADECLFLCVRLLEWCEVDPPPKERSRLRLHADVPLPNVEGTTFSVEALLDRAEDRLATLGPRGAAELAVVSIPEASHEAWWFLLWLGGMTPATTHANVAGRLYEHACGVFGVESDGAFHAELFGVVYSKKGDVEDAERRLQPYA